MADTYAFTGYNKETMARGSAKSAPISFKQSIEICNFLRKKPVSEAKNVLQQVIKEQKVIPFKRFNKDVGHKPGKVAAGRYPKKASQEFLDLLTSVEANAQFKGLNTANLVITHILANKATTTRRFGRQRSRSAKRTNIELVVQEQAPKEKKEKKQEAKQPEQKKVEEKAPAKKAEPKTEAKPAPKQEVKAEAPKVQEKKLESQPKKAEEVKKEAKPAAEKPKEAKAPEQKKEAPKQEAKVEDKK